jgi:hypothetical protein
MADYNKAGKQMRWKLLLRALMFLFGLYVATTGVIHAYTPGYTPTRFYRYRPVTPAYEIATGTLFMVAGIFAPFSQYGD